tara:strand:+ start:242 stop:634 length:393 start_codon:yes stop_codon:yes gene_type:complete
MGFETEIFKGKSLSDLFSEIYDNSRKKDKQISTLISELKPLIEDVGDATLVVPMIKEYLEIGVKNDEQLVKIATIVQRLETSIQKSSGDGDWFDSIDLQGLIEAEDTIEEKIEAVEEELNQEEQEEGDGI